jgi:hypothetical protein
MKKCLERRRKRQKRRKEGRVDGGGIGDEEKGCERTRDRRRKRKRRSVTFRLLHAKTFCAQFSTATSMLTSRRKTVG